MQYISLWQVQFITIQVRTVKEMTFMYLYIFLQSNLLEIPFYYLFFKKDFDFKKILTGTTAINSLTHPIVFFVLMNLKQPYLQNILVAEAFAILMETIFLVYFLKSSLSRAFISASIANLVSWQVAPILTYILFK